MFFLFTDCHFMQFIQGLYTDHMMAGMPPDSFCSVNGSFLLESVQELKKADAAEEEIHRREAAQGMLHLHDTAVTGKSMSIFWEDTVCGCWCLQMKNTTKVLHTQGLPALRPRTQGKKPKNRTSQYPNCLHVLKYVQLKRSELKGEWSHWGTNGLKTSASCCGRTLKICKLSYFTERTI